MSSDIELLDRGSDKRFRGSTETPLFHITDLASAHVEKAFYSTFVRTSVKHSL